MNFRSIQKKLVIGALENSSICRNKYYDLFFRGEKKGKLIFDKQSDIQYILNNCQIQTIPDGRFVHLIDEQVIFFAGKSMIGNIPPDYSLVIENSLEDLLKENEGETRVQRENITTLLAVEDYIQRVLEQLQKQKPGDVRMQYYENMYMTKAETLEDALQRILFWSSIFWQTGHKLVGIGRLDKLLDAIDDPRTDDEVVGVFYDFIMELHKYYAYKSAQLPGDIGQIIILGGLQEDGRYFCNRYTYCILKAIEKAHVTDPKVLLRVSKTTPKSLISEAVRCLTTANGSPLFSNDDVIIPKLIEFGYQPEDAYNYVTSACWEPVSYGNSLEQNNLEDIRYADAFVSMMQDGEIKKCQDFAAVMELYQKHLHQEIEKALVELSVYEWQRDPLFTLFTKGCKQNDKDIAEGGAIYNDYGLLSIGMGNTVNSLLNLKRNVFETQSVSLEELWKAWKKPKKNAAIAESVAHHPKYFGHDEQEVISLTNQILTTTNQYLTDYRNKFGGKVKCGLSSPNYIAKSSDIGMTYDGRKAGEPLSVHISSDDGVAYTELVSFASQLKYFPQGTNGNVIDFFVSPEFLKKNKEKFADFIYLSIVQGFFQMQMNIMSSADLIAAKKNPENYKSLIVRVWGFSAYFIDLPEEYQDLLIERALRSEGKIAG